MAPSEPSRVPDQRTTSYRNPFDDIARDLLVAAVVEVRRPGVRVPQQVLHLLPRHLLLQQVRRRGGPERVAAERGLREAGPLEPPLYDPQQVVPVQPPVRQLPLPPPGRAEQRRLIGAALEARGLQVPLHLQL